MSEPPGDIIASMTSDDALRHAEILAIRQVSDGLAQLNRNFERLSDTAQLTRESVIRIEAQDLKAAITEVRTDFLAAMRTQREDGDRACAELKADAAKLEADHDRRIAANAASVAANRVSIVRMQAWFGPIIAVSAAVLAFIAQWAATMLGAPRH